MSRTTCHFKHRIVTVLVKYSLNLCTQREYKVTVSDMCMSKITLCSLFQEGEEVYAADDPSDCIYVVEVWAAALCVVS